MHFSRRLLMLSGITALALVGGTVARAAPGVQWSSFLGGSNIDYIYGMTTDASGNIYVVGSTGSTDYPVTSGAYQKVFKSVNDVVVSKFSSDGTTLLWSTYLTGTGNEDGRAVAVDAAGNVYVTGNTSSTDFPVTAGALRTTFAGGVSDGFVTKLSSTGQLVYSTYVAGNWDDYPRAIKVDGSGNAIIAGSTNSLDYPITAGVVKTTRNPGITDGADGFITKINATGTAIVWSTYFGSDGGTDNIFGLALDSSGQPTVVGWTLSPTFPVTANAFDRTFAYRREGFVTRLTSSANGYVFSTFIGSNGNFHDECLAVAVDASGASYVTGRTEGTDFPVTAGAPRATYGGGTYDGFALKLSPTGNALVYSTYLGGSGTDEGRGVTVTSLGVASFTGNTDSGNFVTSGNAYDASANGLKDAYITTLSSTGALVYSSYLGGSADDVGYCVALKANGIVMVGGQTASSTFPTTSGAYDRTFGSMNDDFVASLDTGGSGQVAVDPTAPSLVFLAPIRPNPSSGPARISFNLSRPGRATLSIRDIQGRMVRLIDDSEQSAGTHSVTWDGTDATGLETPAGLYFVHLLSPDGAAVQRIARVR